MVFLYMFMFMDTYLRTWDLCDYSVYCYRLYMYLYVHYCGVVSMIWENYTLMFCINTCGVLILIVKFVLSVTLIIGDVQ